jgi:hypothetical protein
MNVLLAGKGRLVGGALSVGIGLGALGLLAYYLSITNAAAVPEVWAVDRVVAYLLMFAGPLLLFLPPSVALKLGPLPLLGAGSWALLGYVLIFVGPPPREQAGIFTYVAFLALVFVALASALAVPLGALSHRLLPPAGRTVEMLRSYRQGALLALFAVSVLAMSPLGVLNWLNGLLVFTVVALTEFFFLARD